MYKTPKTSQTARGLYVGFGGTDHGGGGQS